MTLKPSSSSSSKDSNKTQPNYSLLLTDSAEWQGLMELYRDKDRWEALRDLMAAEASSHLAALVASRDTTEKEQHATIITWITQFMDTNDGIMERLISERKAQLELQNTEAALEGSAYMEPDSGTYVAD